MNDEAKSSEQSTDGITPPEAEKALRHRESYLSAIIENQPGLVWLKDRESRFLAVNDAFAISCGKHRGEEIIGKTDLDIWPRELAEKYRRDDLMVMEMGKSIMVEEPIYDKEETRWFETFKAPVLDGQGAIIGTTGYARDITDSRRAEETLQTNEARLRAVFDSVQDFIFIKDKNCRYIMVNNFFRNRFHVDSSVFIGHTDVEIPIFENKNVTGTIIKNTDALVLQGETAHYELNHCVCGEFITFDIFKTPIRDGQGNVTGICGLSRDITERKRAEEALRESEELFRVSIEKAPDGIYLNDLEGNFLYGNKKAEEIIGYRREDLIGRNFLDLNIIAESSMGKATELLQANIEGRSTGPDDLEMIRKDGSHILIEITTNVIQRGGQTNVLAFVRDITDRKLAEASLQESELFSREIQRIARLGGWKANPHTDYLKWTEGVYDIVEAPRNYMPNLSEGIKYFQPEYIPLINDSLSRCLATGEPFMIECEIITATGRRQWTEVRGLAPVVEGERSSVMGTFQDITDRKEAGKKLRESEELFRLLFNAINDAVFLHYGPGPDGLPGRFIEVNNIACERLGYSRDELLGMSPVDIDAPDTVASIPPIMEKLNKEKQAIWEGVHIARNGRRIPVEINNQLIDFKGIPAVLSTARDITDRKRIESQLIQAQKLEAIGTLAGGMAHNFNNILMGIQGYASLMLMSLKEDHPHYDRLKNIEEQIKSGAGLTQQLLGFARGGKYETKSLDINQVLSQSAALFGKARKEIVMHMSLMEGALIVLADQNQMEQVFLNLFMNASQSMPKGGNIHLETKKMFLGEADMYPYEFASGEYVQITVKDTGMGMDEKTRKRIFEPFFTTKRAGEGTGLGLSTVYGIIKGHRGFITVQSEVGSGTSFAIYLPASGQGPVKKKIVLPETLKGTETILLVDDEKAVLEVNKEFLESLGYRVYGTGSGQEAMAVYMEKQNDIDLVILDMIMPGISGGETFDRLREINSAVRVLLSSGYSINGDAQQILERGCNGFIQKPFHLEKLSQKVREILD